MSVCVYLFAQTNTHTLTYARIARTQTRTQAEIQTPDKVEAFKHLHGGIQTQQQEPQELGGEPAMPLLPASSPLPIEVEEEVAKQAEVVVVAAIKSETAAQP